MENELITVKQVTMNYRVREADQSRNKLSNFLHPSYRTINALANINFQVRAGDVLGYVGENGAGKSTTIKILLGILRKTSGSVTVLGHDPMAERKKIAPRVGTLMGQKSQLWWELPLQDSFYFLQKMYQRTDHADQIWLAELVERLQVGSFLKQPVRELSLGQRMRGEFIAALLHQPEIVFLDEPTLGLDVATRAAVLDLLLQINREKRTTILYTSHEMADVEKIANRLLLLEQGQVGYDGDLDRFKDQYAAYQRVAVQGVTDLKTIPGVTIYQRNNTNIICLLDQRLITTTAFIQQVPLLTQQAVKGITVLPNNLEMILLLRAQRKGGA